MGYMHIDNLYKSQDILLFKWCYALEKVHGTSAHLGLKKGQPVRFFSGGEKHEKFVAVFDEADVIARFDAITTLDDIVVYGEAYGGKQQGMRLTYGDQLRFIVFDVKVGEHWLSVPDMEQVAHALGLEVVPYAKLSTELADLDRERDRPSIVAQLRGMGDDKVREGVVLRPPIEVVKNNGARIIAKHKCERFSERATPQKIADPEKLAVLAEADAIANEWVTPMRLSHVLDKLQVALDMSSVRDVITAMTDDVRREAAGEIVESKEAASAIGRRTALLFKSHIQDQLRLSAQEGGSK
jgi:hypothetical protein